MTGSKYKIRIIGQDKTWGLTNTTDIDLIVTCDSVAITQK